MEQPKDREACGLQASLACLLLEMQDFLILHISAKAWTAWTVWTASTGHFKNTLNTLNTCHLSDFSVPFCDEVVLDAIVASSEPSPGDLGDQRQFFRQIHLLLETDPDNP